MSGSERIHVRDHRQQPVWLDSDDLARLATCFAGRRLPLARSVYVALAELVAETPADAVTEATRREVADRAGLTTRVLDEYVEALEVERFITVERRRDGAGGNLPNVWVLGAPGEGEKQNTLGVADRPHLQSSLLDDGGKESPSPARARVAGDVAELLRGRGLPDELVHDAVSHFAAGRRIDGRKITAEEMVKAAVVLAEWNEQRGTESGLGPNLAKIVMRIRDRPAMSAEQHARLVQSAFRLRWWERNGRRRRGPLTPSVIWGSSDCFENVFQDAAAEARGEKSAERRGRFQKASPVEDE
jgi:hypothetical protein